MGWSLRDRGSKKAGPAARSGKGGGVGTGERGKFFADVGEFGVGGEVFGFEGIGFGVEEHGAVLAVGAEFGVAVLLGADGDAVEGLAVFGPDGVGGVFPIGVGFVEEWGECCAFKAGRGSEVAKFGEGGV